MQTKSFLKTLNSTNISLTDNQRTKIQNISKRLIETLTTPDKEGRPIPPKDLMTTATVLETLAK